MTVDMGDVETDHIGVRDNELHWLASMVNDGQTVTSDTLIIDTDAGSIEIRASVIGELEITEHDD